VDALYVTCGAPIRHDIALVAAGKAWYADAMETVQFNELTDDVQTFVRQAVAAEGLVVKDESGRPYGSFVPFVEAPPKEQEKAWERIRRLQAKVALHMRQEGATEEELDHLLQDD
jgi:hypothetical protein